MFARKLSCLALFLLLCASFAQAKDWAVSVGGNDLRFHPSSLTVSPGDTVTFTNAGGFHNVVSDTGLFSSGSASTNGWTLQVPFNTAGTFGFHCEIHGAPGSGMAGSVTVQASQPAPDFGLSAQSNSPTVAQGGSVTDSITITPMSGFSDNVTFSASDLPDGVSASFAANGATASVLTLNASATAAVGTSTVTVTGTSGSLSHTLPLSLTVNAAPPAFSIVPGITGAWYLPAQSGHGFNVEVLPNNVFLAFWYVYDNNGNNFYLLGQGTYAGDTATMDAYEATGGMFPPNFDKNKIVRTKWGTMTMRFSDCNNATVQWAPIVPGFTSGSMALIRLTEIKGVSCP